MQFELSSEILGLVLFSDVTDENSAKYIGTYSKTTDTLMYTNEKGRRVRRFLSMHSFHYEFRGQSIGQFILDPRETETHAYASLQRRCAISFRICMAR